MFVTDVGRPVPVVTAAIMREIDRIAIADQTPSLSQMMENAGRSLALAAIDHMGPGWRERSVAVCAGGGGNGGGGICAARHLANHGGDVVLVLSESARLNSVTAQQLGIYLKTPGRVDHRGYDPDLILDAVIGYGLTGAPRGPTRELIAWMREVRAPVISLDVPSGLDATTGDAPGDAVQAMTTLTLALPKTGLVSPLAGDLWLADLGIPPAVYAAAGVHLSQALFEGRYRIHLVRRTT